MADKNILGEKGERGGVCLLQAGRRRRREAIGGTSGAAKTAVDPGAQVLLLQDAAAPCLQCRVRRGFFMGASGKGGKGGGGRVLVILPICIGRLFRNGCCWFLWFIVTVVIIVAAITIVIIIIIPLIDIILTLTIVLSPSSPNTTILNTKISAITIIITIL